MRLATFLKNPRWYVHLLIATVGAMTVGFIPAALMGRWTLSTGLDTVGFPIPIVAFVLGYVFSPRHRCEGAIWVWIPPLLLFVWEAHELASGWNATWSNKTRMQYVYDNLLGVTRACRDRECLDELFVTMPLVSSICYSLAVASRMAPLKRIPHQTRNF